MAKKSRKQKKSRSRGGGGHSRSKQHSAPRSNEHEAPREPASVEARPGTLPEGSAARLRIELHGFWHPGTGRGDGAGADAVVHRDGAGLPFIPGRSVKGLLRQAVRLGIEAGIEGLDEDVEKVLFGSELPGFGTSDRRIRSLEQERFATRPGVLLVGSAMLGDGAVAAQRWRSFAKSPEGTELVRHLVRSISSTALDEQGVAVDHSLRTIEVVAPVTLYATLEARSLEPGAPSPIVPWAAIDSAVRLFLRAVGSHRNRGLGRCTTTIVPEAS